MKKRLIAFLRYVVYDTDFLYIKFVVAVSKRNII